VRLSNFVATCGTSCKIPTRPYFTFPTHSLIRIPTDGISFLPRKDAAIEMLIGGSRTGVKKKLSLGGRREEQTSERGMRYKFLVPNLSPTGTRSEWERRGGYSLIQGFLHLRSMESGSFFQSVGRSGWRKDELGAENV
jgi:hypothetical protein